MHTSRVTPMRCTSEISINTYFETCLRTYHNSLIYQDQVYTYCWMMLKACPRKMVEKFLFAPPNIWQGFFPVRYYDSYWPSSTLDLAVKQSHSLQSFKMTATGRGSDCARPKLNKPIYLWIYQNASNGPSKTCNVMCMKKNKCLCV